ncbi:MAG: DMT family transporter [Desulfobacterales bacterium]
MTPAVMLVVLTAALLHACWNFLVKRNRDPHLGMTAVVLGHTPFALAAIFIAPPPEEKAIPFILAGAVLHTGYQLFLLASYRRGDLSQVYPLARGSAPLIVAAVSLILLGAQLSRLELAAVALIATGIMSLALVRRSEGLRNGRAAALALVTGGFIASYSLVDGMGARTAGTALGYYGWLSTANALLFALGMGAVRPETVKRAVWREPRLSLSGGGASFLAYAMVTWAFTLAPIPLVTALRETSILFALLLGVFFLKERLDLLKLFATLITMFGVGLLRASR